MRKVLLFAGTTEGRKLAEYFDMHRIPVVVSVATEYGAALLRPSSYLEIVQGKKDRAQILGLLRDGDYCCCVDATHPFAVQATEEIRAACEEAGIPCLRLARETNHSGPADQDRTSAGCGAGTLAGSGLIYTDTLGEAVAVLRTLPGNIFVLTGSRQLSVVAEGIGEPDRLYARVLPTKDSLDLCRDSGLAESHIIAMQGPFSTELNAAMYRQIGAGCILTKESGSAGGFDEKILAAEECGIPAVVIRNPERTAGKNSGEEAGLPGRAAGRTAVRASGERSGKQPRLLSLREVISGVEQILGIPRTITLAGIGPGDRSCRTGEYWEALGEADILFGAPRLLAQAQNDLRLLQSCGERGAKPFGAFDAAGADLPGDAADAGHSSLLPPCYPWYQGERIFFFLQEHPQYRHPMAVFSGDSGLFSGARKVREIFLGSPFAELTGGGGRASCGSKRSSPADNTEMGFCAAPSDDAVKRKTEEERQFGSRWRVHVLCGISSVSAMAARLGVSWQDSAIVSAHGRRCSVTARLRTCGKMFLLVSDVWECARIGQSLLKAQKERTLPGNLRVACGYRLCLPEERVQWITVQTLADFPEMFPESGRGSEAKEQLFLLYFENPASVAASCVPGISDERFIRGRVPMTKEEIRALVLSRLHLTRNAVMWDVGAGTGSVSVEAAMLCPEGTVYAIERTGEALSLLQANRDKFASDNLEIVSGEAPAALNGLPAPGHVFIGGSGGRMEDILHVVLRANPETYVVISCVTLETLREVQRCIEILAGRITQPRIVQISVSRTHRLGNYHLLQAQNPVFLIDFKGRRE